MWFYTLQLRSADEGVRLSPVLSLPCCVFCLLIVVWCINRRRFFTDANAVIDSIPITRLCVLMSFLLYIFCIGMLGWFGYLIRICFLLVDPGGFR